MTYPRSARSLLLFIVLSLSLVWAGCDLLESDGGDEVQLETTGIFVGNGGNFTEQNGSITIFDPSTGGVSRPPALQLNAFLISLAQQDGHLYALLNTGFSSGRVDIISLEDRSPIEQSDSLGATRYLAFASDARAYVTNLDGTVTPIDPQTGAVLGDPIQAGASAAGVVVVDGTAFVANYDGTNPQAAGEGTTLTMIDTGRSTVAGTLDLGCEGPKQLFVDAEQEIAVVCTGRTDFDENFAVTNRTSGQVVFVDPSAETVISRVELDSQLGSANGTQVAHFAREAGMLHAISSLDMMVFRVSTSTNTLTTEITVPNAEDLTGLSAVAYDGIGDRLYLGRLDVANPFTSAGAVVVLNEAGEQVDRFTVGPAPSHILIRQEPSSS